MARKKMLKPSYLFFLIVLSLSLNALGQDTVKKNYLAERAKGQISIDGELTEEDWTTGTWEGGFVQNRPYENNQPSQKTEFKLVFDNDYVYVAIKAWDTAPDSIVKRLSRRDKLEGDNVGIVLDSYHDLRTGFSLSVSASGVKSDFIYSNDGTIEDPTWDPIWFTKTKIYPWGWAAEFKIPITQLRFEKNSNTIWGFEVFRQIYRHAEMDLWQPVARNASGFIHFCGELSGMGAIRPQKQLDITPYMVSSLHTYPKEEGNPFGDGSDTHIKTGVDAKIGVTNNLTLDVSINPDFGQVEADPSQVNLTGFETYFIEKRPFFIEGNNITRFPLGFGDGDLSEEQLFYSRRIGRRPSGDPELKDGEFMKSPDFTSIIGAAKLTGKTESGWSVGVIESVGNEEDAEIDYNGIRRKELIEPLTNYFVGRIQRDLNKGNTIIGAMVTNTNRKLGNSSLNDLLHKNGSTAGIDFKQYFKNKSWVLEVNSIFSQVNGSKNAITETQTSTSHLFQRPNGTRSFNHELTSLTGQGGNLQFGKIDGNLNMMFLTLWKSPGLELNDIGFLRSTDEILPVFYAGYKFNKPTGIMREANININEWNGWDFAGNFLFTGGNINGQIQFTNQWTLFGGLNFETKILSNTILRGGPALKVPGSKNINFMVMTDPRKKFSVHYTGVHSKYENGTGTMNLFSPELKYKPLNTLEIFLEPACNLIMNDLQYVDEIYSGGKPNYLLARIDSKTLSLSMRINYNIKPDLSIEYWGQPFIASGKYSRFKSVIQPKANNYAERFKLFNNQDIALNSSTNYYQVDEDGNGTTDYSFENPNFNVNEFLSNLVLRWEYIPGSVLFLVWSQNRSYETDKGEFDFAHNLNNLYNLERPSNVFLIKLSYRFGLH